MQPGTVLAHYQVVELIGKGGMGEVYRAHDTKLGRDVALKILPSEFAADSERMIRFEREAKVLASLHHPNVASIFGFESVADCTFLVMELVEGKDLSEVLSQGSLSVNEAVDIARQIAEGLEEAHEKGIVHRDLKPANVKLTPDGKVKVLDFGLARAYGGETPGKEVISSAPTMTAAMTQVGTVLGTAAYMSPEQARGKEVDRRADIWAFGVVLFEMLTGKPVFVGETASDTLAGILKSDPPWDRLPKEMPNQVERVLRRCLAKDPRQRLRDIGEARVRLENPEAESGMFSGSVAAVHETGSRLGQMLPWGLLVAALGLAALMGLGVFKKKAAFEKPIAYRFDLTIETSSDIPNISPDGRQFAYVGDFEGENVIWIRAFNEEAGRPLPATDTTDGQTYWSADSRSLAYFTDDALMQINLAGGAPKELAKAPVGWRTGSWSPQGTILMEVLLNPQENGWYLWQPDRRTFVKIERSLPQEDRLSKNWPTFLPDGEHFIFVHYIDGVRQAVLGKVGSTQAEPLFPSDTRVLVAADGWYIFVRKGQLLTQAFDRQSFAPLGEAKVLSESVSFFEPTGSLSASASDQGNVIHLPQLERIQLAWFDRQGHESAMEIEDEIYREAELSPDGRFLAVVTHDSRTGTGDLWVRDLDRGLSNRVTASSWSEYQPIWSPDGRSIVFSDDRSGPPNIYIVDADGGEPREIVAADEVVQYPSDWTAHGDLILFSQRAGQNLVDIWQVNSEGGEARVLLNSDSSESGAVVSPDGRWLAFVSDTTGRGEVYLRPFGREGASRRVSIDGGWEPKWGGNEQLFFMSPGEKLKSVLINFNGDRPEIARPTVVVELGNRNMRGYNLHPDGRILITYDTSQNGVVVAKVIVGWE